MGKISKKNGGDPSKEVQWSSVMDDALVDAFLHQVIIGGRVHENFTSKAYDDIEKELTLKKNFHEFYDIYKDGLSGFGWNDFLNIWTVEPEVWEPLIASKLAVKKWMTTPMPNYSKMAQLWAKDRAKGDHAETAKEKNARYAASTTIDEIDNLISQNEVSLENFEVEDDQRSPKTNVACSRVKKRRLAEDDELRNVIFQSFDNVSMAIDRATEVMAKYFSKSYGAEVHIALGVLDLDPISKTEAYIYLMENQTYKEMFFGCPDHERKCVLLLTPKCKRS
ncbi:hypothetical protein ACB092_02G149200 [Castanea dentata]